MLRNPTVVLILCRTWSGRLHQRRRRRCRRRILRASAKLEGEASGLKVRTSRRATSSQPSLRSSAWRGCSRLAGAVWQRALGSPSHGRCFGKHTLCHCHLHGFVVCSPGQHACSLKAPNLPSGSRVSCTSAGLSSSSCRCATATPLCGSRCWLGPLQKRGNVNPKPTNGCVEKHCRRRRESRTG